MAKSDYLTTPQEAHREKTGRGMLTSIYLNHITREALSQIKCYGYSDEGALRICNKLIYHSIDAYGRSPATYVTPQPPHNPSMQSPAVALDMIDNHWKELRADLSKLLHESLGHSRV